MIPKECKRLAEVDFPIAVVSKHAAREKSIRHGHPSTLHLWWARRPLAACRAMLLGLLLPDPCDSLCPEEFRHKARRLLPQVGCGDGETDEKLRHGLLKFIGDFANWDVAANQTYLEVARGLVRAAHDVEAPLVVDPFAGGGSIPLEALRLGCEAFASDLNPVACLILKVMLEDIPRHGPQLATDLRRVGAEIKRQAEKELAELYPTDPDGATPIAYLWARTVQCEAPNCGAEIPLVRLFWLCKKANRRRALKPRVERPREELPRVEFEVCEPKTEHEVPSGTVTRAKATCLCCGTVLPPERVRAQLVVQLGGADAVFGEVSGGPANRSYADIFLRYAVALIGPGDAGPWRPGRDDSAFDGGFVRRFTTEVQPGDIVLLQTGISIIRAVGLVASDYLYLPQFDDVNGWDLQHARRVRWCELPSEYDFGTPVFGANPPRLFRIWSAISTRLCRTLRAITAHLLADHATASTARGGATTR